MAAVTIATTSLSASVLQLNQEKVAGKAVGPKRWQLESRGECTRGSIGIRPDLVGTFVVFVMLEQSSRAADSAVDALSQRKQQPRAGHRSAGDSAAVPVADGRTRVHGGRCSRGGAPRRRRPSAGAGGGGCGNGGRTAKSRLNVAVPDKRITADDQVCFAAGYLYNEWHHLTAVEVLRPHTIHL